VVGKTMRENYLKFNSNTFVLSNGFDSVLEESVAILDTKFSITHIGMLNEDRNPKALWKALKELGAEVEGFFDDLEVQLIGKVDATVLELLLVSGLEKQLKQIDYVPHSEVQGYQKRSQVLLLAVNKVPSAKGIVTGKIFEYLVAKRPILAIGPEDGDLAEILKETNAGTIVDFENTKKLKEIILNLYLNYKKNELNVDSKNIAQYHRKEITKQLAVLLKNLK
jgi:glycosyltransferase involved in cell wall biosynthesis